MPYIAPHLTDTDLSRQLTESLGSPHRGKVRDTYPLDDNHLLMIATDRISSNDFVLGSAVPGKGKVLTHMTVNWLTGPLKDVMPNHLVAHGPDVDNFLPANRRGNPEVHERGLVVRRLDIAAIECVGRVHLTGSGFKGYNPETGEFGVDNGKGGQEDWGYSPLPVGLHDGSKLPRILFTPTTKAEEGHDLPVSRDWVFAHFGRPPEELTLLLLSVGAEYARQRGIIVADTKFELGWNQRGDWVLADEVLTPDSSRLWLVSDWEAAKMRRKAPAGYDKEPVRQWLRTVTFPNGSKIGDLDPKNPEHAKMVGELRLPDQLIEQTIDRYITIDRMLAV